MPITFSHWMALVDQELYRLCYLSHDDLQDIDYWGLHEGNTNPVDAAHEALVNAGMGELLTPSLLTRNE